LSNTETEVGENAVTRPVTVPVAGQAVAPEASVTIDTPIAILAMFFNTAVLLAA